MNEIISKLIRSGESLHLELKEANEKLPRSLWETYSSFANTDGGTILLGIKENKNEVEFDKRYEITGVNNPESLITDFWNNINNDQIVNSNILMDKNVKIIDSDSSFIIKIDVPKASQTNKPIYIRGNPYNGTFLRNFDGDYKASIEVVNEMIRDSSISGNDGELIEGYTPDDIDFETLQNYQNDFRNSHRNHIWNNIDEIEFLKNIGGYALDRRTGKWWLTAAGLLMFGKGLSIREYFDNIRMDYLDQSNLLPDQRWSDRLTYDGSWENNLYNFINKVIPKLISNLKSPFQLNGIKRNDDSNVMKAIREAVINMLIHSDYKISGILKIIKKDNGLQFSNPGSLILSVEEVMHGGYSRARNPKIQKMFELIGYGESIGSGFSMILKTWQEEGWRLPDLNYNSFLNQVELNLWMFPLISDELEKYLKQLYFISFDQLTRTDKIIILTALIEEEFSEKRLKNLLGSDNLLVKERLNWLIKNNYLNSKEFHHEIKYFINQEKIKFEKENPEKRFSINETTNSSELNLNKTQKKIIDYLNNNESISIKEVLKITNIKTRQGAHKALKQLINKGLITMSKIGKTSYYYLTYEWKVLKKIQIN